MLKKAFSVVLIVGMLGICSPASAVIHHEPFLIFFPGVYDITGALARALQAAVKFFLTDDNKLVAELVYDGGGSSGCKKGGCGGAYTGDAGSASPGVALNAVASPIADIPAEKNAYPSDIQIQKTGLSELAQYRIQSIAQEQASLERLSANEWEKQYRAQQRAIQAMADALVMKKAYSSLSAAADIGEGSYADYSAAASTVATRRLILDGLMVLRKRVIAARVRARAETMEMDIKTEVITTAPAVKPAEEDTSSSAQSMAKKPVVTDSDE